jgi:hypothetical protein
MLRVSSVGSGWYSAGRGGVFASPTPQTAGLVAELFTTERDRFPPFQLQFIGAFEGVFVLSQPGRVVEVGHIQRAITYILIDWCRLRRQDHFNHLPVTLQVGSSDLVNHPEPIRLFRC